jgi:hypothetical protein
LGAYSVIRITRWARRLPCPYVLKVLLARLRRQRARRREEAKVRVDAPIAPVPAVKNPSASIVSRSYIEWFERSADWPVIFQGRTTRVEIEQEKSGWLNEPDQQVVILSDRKPTHKKVAGGCTRHR